VGKTAAAVVGTVLAVGIAIAAPYLAPLALGLIGVTATATAVAIATAVIGLTLSVGLALGMRALVGGAPVPKAPVGPPQVFRQSISDSFIIYGKRRVGGLLVFFHPRRDGDDHYRYFVIAVAGHECHSLVSFMLNDEVVTIGAGNVVTSGKYANNAWLYFKAGTSNQSALQNFVDECGGKWTADHKGNGIAYIAAKFRLTEKVVQAGMPSITAIVEGKAVFDPRTPGTAYSRNAALIFYDWMKIPREEGGFGAYPDEIPDNAFISAQANVCDETVEGAPRYALDAVIVTGSTPSQVRDAMVVNMAGSYSYVAGKHLMRPGYWVPISRTLLEDDLAGPIQVSPFMASDRSANQVTGNYVNPDDGYQARAFATQSVSGATDIRQMDLDLAFTTNKHQAERIAAIMLNRAQHEKTVVWPMNIVGLGVQALDTVQLDATRYGLNNYAFTVGSWSLSPDFSVIANLREESEDIYLPPAAVTPTPPPAIDEADRVIPLSELQLILRETYPRGMKATAEDVGTDVTVTVHGTAGTAATFTLDYPGTLDDVTVGPATIPGLAFSTTYYLYADVDDPGDDTPTFGATTVYGTALNSADNPRRIFLNRSIVTPADGGAPTSSGGAGSGGGGFDPGDGSGLVSYP
jgi:hypothetical protein